MIKTVKWEDIDPNYVPGQTVTNFKEVMTSLKERCYVQLPQGFSALIGDKK